MQTMSPASILVNTALARARDPKGMATPAFPTSAIPLLSTACGLVSTSQQVINGIVGDVIQSFALTVQPRTLIYQVSASVPASVKIETVRDASGRDLDYMGEDINQLAWLDTRWVTKTDAAPRCWMQCGRDLLILYPGVNTAQTVNVVCSTLTAALQNPNDVSVVQPETDNLVLDLVELLLLLKARDYAPLKTTLDRFQARLAEEQVEQR
jgi:hypothetical protein